MENLDEFISLPPRISSVARIGGEIKTLPEDFIVSEIIDETKTLSPFDETFCLPGKPGLFLHFVLIKNDIDTESALNWIAKLWGIERNNFTIAGTKDKKAITAQRVSVWGAKKGYEQGKIRELDYPSFKAKGLSFKLREIRLGDLWGNHFTIVARNIQSEGEKIQEIVEQSLEEIDSFGGIPNAFGPQRFGETRPITHSVGKYLLESDIQQAVRYYIGYVFEGEPEQTKKARKVYWEGENAKTALEVFPHYLKNERKLLNSLVRYPSDFKRAFMSFSYHLQKLFVHAYQSYLFNKYLKKRYLEFSTDFTSPLLGEKVQKGRIFVPIIGAKTELEGEVKKIYNEIFEEEKISISNFNTSFIQKIGGKGTYRSILFQPQNISYSFAKDELNENKTKLKLAFRLKKGSYATMVIRALLG